MNLQYITRFTKLFIVLTLNFNFMIYKRLYLLLLFKRKKRKMTTKINGSLGGIPWLGLAVYKWIMYLTHQL